MSEHQKYFYWMKYLGYTMRNENKTTISDIPEYSRNRVENNSKKKK